MYNREMLHKYAILPIVILIGILLSASSLSAETAVRDTSIINIARNVWNNDYTTALKKTRQLVKSEPDNPLGYFLLGTIYQSISEEFRTDRFGDKVTGNLDRAINMAEKFKDSEPENPDWFFICGASYGYRALYRAFHGSWWGAFRDGSRSSSNLKKCLEIDSTYYDAYLGLGAYKYYKTIKSKLFLWLPFVSDRREEGINDIRKVIEDGVLASYNARESLLRILYEEGRYQDGAILADSLLQLNPKNIYCLLFNVLCLTELNQLDEASEKLNRLRKEWRKSSYHDRLGIHEADLLSAMIAHKSGRSEHARESLDKILAKKEFTKTNAYFAETYDRARDLSGKIK
jgi:tetratricopeptide (TPR) repeat protein